jgi:hypothetical protein
VDVRQISKLLAMATTGTTERNCDAVCGTRG